MRPRRLTAFFAPLLGMLAVTYGAQFAELGLWSGLKLTAAAALAQIVGLALVPVVALGLARVPAVAKRLTPRGATLRASLGVIGTVLVVLVAWKTSNFLLAGANMASNLFSAGGWGLFWVFATGVLLLAAAFPGIRRQAAASTELLGVLGLFLVVALIVHGTSHPGRLGPADSFNRIAFHVVPLIWWLAASLVGAALHDADRTGILHMTHDAGEPPRS